MRISKKIFNPTFDEILFGLFVLFVFFLPFTRISIPVVGLYEFTLADFILAFLFFVNIVFIKRIAKYYRSYIFVFLLFVASVVASGVMVRSFRLYFIDLLPFAFAFLILVSTLSFFSGGKHLKQIITIGKTIYLSLLLSTVPVYYQLLAGVKLAYFYDKHGWRYTFLSQNPNQFGVYLILFFFLLTLISLKYKPKSLKYVFFLMVVFIPVALFSGSRTAALIFAVNFLTVSFILFLNTSTVKKMIIVPTILAVMIISVPFFLNFIKTQGGQINRALAVFEIVSSGGEVIGSETATGKSQSEGMQLYFKYPIFGVGMANKPMHSKVRLEIHNTYIKFLAETGTIGFVCFLLIFFFPVVVMMFSRSGILIKLTLLLFYMMFAAMNWPHMLLRQRWVWFFMIMCFIIARINEQGHADKSRLNLLN